MRNVLVISILVHKLLLDMQDRRLGARPVPDAVGGGAFDRGRGAKRPEGRGRAGARDGKGGRCAAARRRGAHRVPGPLSGAPEGQRLLHWRHAVPLGQRAALEDRAPQAPLQGAPEARAALLYGALNARGSSLLLLQCIHFWFQIDVFLEITADIRVLLRVLFRM